MTIQRVAIIFDDQARLTAEELVAALDGVPPDKLHCPALAIAALRDALSHWPAAKESMTDGATSSPPRQPRD
jgi:hypothetical protein